jgi:hypothetical protein
MFIQRKKQADLSHFSCFLASIRDKVAVLVFGKKNSSGTKGNFGQTTLDSQTVPAQTPPYQFV